jgi:hypothetical protein
MEANWRTGATGLMNKKGTIGIAVAACALGVTVLYNFPPTQYSFYPRCPFFAATHLLCPGCGSTRALYWLLHGNMRAAWHYNALFTLLGPVVLGWLAFCCYRVMRYDQVPKIAIPRTVTACLVVATVLFAVARNTVLAF